MHFIHLRADLAWSLNFIVSITGNCPINYVPRSPVMSVQPRAGQSNIPVPASISRHSGDYNWQKWTFLSKNKTVFIVFSPFVRVLACIRDEMVITGELQSIASCGDNSRLNVIIIWSLKTEISNSDSQHCGARRNPNVYIINLKHRQTFKSIKNDKDTLFFTEPWFLLI